jgi:cell division protein ZapE
MSVREVYEAELLKRDYQSDPAQLRAIDALERPLVACEEVR